MMRRLLASACCAVLLLGVAEAQGDVAHQVHLVQQIEVDGEIVETIDLTPYTGDGFTTSNATARTGYIFTHWSTSAVQEFANRDPWGRAYEQVSFSLYEGTTNTAHYVKEDLDEDGDGMPDGFEIYWYGDLDETPTSDTDGDGIGFERELEQGTNPHFADTYTRGVINVSAKPQFFKVILKSEPEGSLFATVTNDVAPGVNVSTDAYSPNTSSFAYWNVSGVDVATRDVFGRAYNKLSFTMPTNDVELVAVCREDEAARQSLYWYGNETTELTSDTDGDGFTFAEEIRIGTSPLFADSFVRGVINVSAKPQFFKVVLRSEPEGSLFATVTNDVAPGVAVSMDTYSPNTSSFAYWSSTGVDVATRDIFGRAYDSLSFTMPTNDVELVAVCREDEAARQSLYWYGNETTELTSDTDGDGFTFAEEIRVGTSPLFADRFSRGVMCASIKPQFFKLIKRSDPAGALFATTTNDVAPGVSVSADAYSPNTSSFAYWSSVGVDVATRDVFGRAYDALSFTMPTNDVELVAVCRDEEAARQSLYWYGNETMELTSDTDGDGFTFAEEIRVGMSPLFADRFSRGVMCASIKPQFFKLIKRSDPAGALFATTTNDVAPGVSVSTDAYSPNTSAFACWSLSGAADVATRDVFGRAYDKLSFTMPTNDVELVAVCRDEEAARQSLYWYGNETTELTSDTDGDGFTFAEEIHVGTSPLFADCYSRGIIYALSEELETDLQPFEQMRGAIVDGEYVELFTSGLAGNAATSETFGENICPLAVDVDGDGLFDLIVVSRGEMRLYLNKGSAANPDFVPTTTGDDAWENFKRLLCDMTRPLICAANGVYYVSDGGGPIYAFTLADGSIVATGLVGIPGVLDGRLFALTAAGTLVADGWTLMLDTPVIDGVSVSMADIDSDGRTDLLVSDLVGHIWLYRNVTATSDDAVSFKLLHKVWAGTGVGFAENMTISLIDWDDDGDEDVLIGMTNGKLMLLRDPRTGRPTNVQAYPGVDNVLLTWDPNSQPRIRGYNVYRSPDAESFARIVNQTPLPRYRDVPSVLRDYWYRVTGVSRFYIAGNSTPTVHESMPTDAVYVQFRPSVWLNDTSGFTGLNVTVVVSMNNSMGISADGLSMTFAFDAAVLEPRGIRMTGLTDEVDGAVEIGEGTVCFAAHGGTIATGAGQFLLLDFKIKDVHDITETTVTLNAATVQALDGRSVVLDLPKSATIEISDSDPIVPAIVAVSVSDAAVESETEFELPVTVTTTEALTNFTATLTWDETLLEFKGIEGATSVRTESGGSAEIVTSGGDFSLVFFAKDPASAETNFAARVRLSDIAAIDCHGFTVSADDAEGTVLIKNVHPWVAAHVSIATEDQKVETLEEVTIPFKVTSDESLTSGSFTVEWDDDVLELKDVGGNTYTVQNDGGDFLLTFLARDQHNVTKTQVWLTSASVTDVHGFVVASTVPVVATILVHDAHPLVPADVAMTLGDVQAKTETEFEMMLSISMTETLTNLVLSLDYDTELLEFRSGVLNYANDVPSTVTLKFYAKENHTIDSTIVTVRPQSGVDDNGLAAVLPTEVTGTVVLADANPWHSATVSVGVANVSVDTCTAFDVPVVITATEALTNFAATVEWDANALELKGSEGASVVGDSFDGSATLSTAGGNFMLTFYAKDQHNVSQTDVRLVDMTAVDEHGLSANAIADVAGTVLIRDAHPLVPADVAIRAGDAQVETLQSFSIPVTITSSKTLTNLSVSVGYDAAVLDFRSCVGATWNDGIVTAEGTVPQSFTLTFYAKDQHTVTETAITLSNGAAICTDALAANVTCANGMVYLTDSNPPVAPTFAMSVLDVRAESGQPFVVNVGTESVGDLSETTFTIEWDATKMSFVGAREAATIETLSDNSRRLTFSSTGTDNRYHLNFTAAKITGLRESAQVSVTAAVATGVNGLAAVLQTQLPLAASVLIVREVGKYDPGDIDGDGRYTDNDLDMLKKYIAYLNVLSTGNKYAIAAVQKYRLTGQALKAADVNSDGVVDANDIAMLAQFIAAAKEEE